MSGFLCVCINLEEFPAMMKIVDAHPDVYASAGFHPLQDASSPAVICDEVKDALLQCCLDKRVVAIGETGLDFYYSPENVDAQIEQFKMHLDIAKQVSKPVIVHTRQAKAETIRAIQAYPEVTGVMHCFTEDWPMAKQALDCGYYISLSGIVTFKNAAALREVAKKVPADRLLVETDSPYLAPVPYRGKPNQPAYVVEVAECLAQLRGVSLAELAGQTSENFYRLFSIDMNTIAE